MYNSAFTLGHVALYVKNLELQSLYYQQVLGMTIINKEEQMIDLGVAGNTLVRLIKTNQDGLVANSYGLYHLAIVLPSRKELGQIFKHFIDNGVHLIGASDHDYSEAIYLEDTEGNGIEIYTDRPMADWDIRKDGRIIGGTKPMDVEGIYGLGKATHTAYQLPVGSRMGHVHLSVRETAISSLFYQKVLQMQEKFSVPSASWLASGDYHHHLAVNEWGGKNLEIRKDGMPGLAYYTVIYTDKSVYEEVVKAVQKENISLHIGTHEASFVDADGIKTKLMLARD